MKKRKPKRRARASADAKRVAEELQARRKAYELGVKAGRLAVQMELREALGIGALFTAGPVISEWRVSNH